MPFVYRNLTLSLSEQESSLPARLATRLGIKPQAIADFRIIRKGVDARKHAIKLVYALSFTLDESSAAKARSAKDPSLEWQPDPVPDVIAPVRQTDKIVIVGSGPAGLFTALRLAEYGMVATIIERGQPVEQRALDVKRFWRDGILNPESNVQFGEGGAGTFSDGKLTSRSKDPLVPWILKKLADFGAPEEICYLAKPHIGTDLLRKVISSIRNHLLDRGFVIRFGCRLNNIQISNGRVCSISINGYEELPCDRLVLATGHSARDTYELLERLDVPLQRKPFAVGLRVEHPQELIDKIQYSGKRHSNLPAADYAVTWNDSSGGRSAYSFCMCPGGVVIAGSSEEGGVVTNGMSGHSRNSPFANSALVVNVGPDDFGGPGPLAGVRFQRHWENQAFICGGNNYSAPAQNLLSFLGLPGKPATSTYRPGIVETDLTTILPPFIATTLRSAIPGFDLRMKGFVTAEATLIGIETRTSAPVRILRDAAFESVGVKGLHPAGEGAGYAGGIMSSAVDGVKIADAIAGLAGRENRS
jgi:uncharacterized protein